MNKHNLYDPCQFAYRKGHSTQTCLIRLLDDVRLVGDSRLVTILVSIDFSKAFDRVNHNILLNKLKSLNFSYFTLKYEDSLLFKK